MDRKIQQTNWINPKYKILTQWGLLTYREYLNKEKNRIERQCAKLGEIRTRGKDIALFCNP